ncbi:MAG: RpiB/LacA/LacB family sugar-phosphate isomerase [Candidatus Jorgensenbacteria bacterium]|nr:RpiB/LacA/LacB family sugar-phosphate isomerase [Candidatus Jorgensenbacteria bacterium]
MVIYLGADHRGFQLKEHVKQVLLDRGYPVVDLGNAVYDESDDYPDFAQKVAQKVSVDFERGRGILFCGSGVGVDIVANKFPHVRSALAGTPNQAFDSRADDNSNILSLGANYIEPEDAIKIISTWLETPFSEDERHKNRLRKIDHIETVVAEIKHDRGL